LLITLFGAVEQSKVIINQPDKAQGELILKNADVEWFLSIDEDDLPGTFREKGQRSFRQLTLNKEPIDFSEGFTDLHTKSYEEIIAGRGFGIGEARGGIELVHRLRGARVAR
jgi:UDP-N-acetyl-2-amino-2-deoxyglucuronate dehydrogenase